MTAGETPALHNEMKTNLLHSTFEAGGAAAPEQHLTCYLVNNCVALDAGSLSLTKGASHRASVRDVIVTHPHLDHIAGLPFFIDDLFDELREPIRVHATAEAIDVLERNIFNWDVYPRFSEIENKFGKVMEYCQFTPREEFRIGALTVKAIPVNHQVPTVGLLVSDGRSTMGLSSDTAETDEFWEALNSIKKVDALLIEASFPNEMAELADVSFHLTPNMLRAELGKLNELPGEILAVHLKPAFYAEICRQLADLDITNLSVMQPGRDYEWR
jgi:cAMP phosphodiesterase